MASRSARSGVSLEVWLQRPVRTVPPLARAQAVSSRTSLLLPTPAGPRSKTVVPARSHAARKASSSAERPTRSRESTAPFWRRGRYCWGSPLGHWPTSKRLQSLTQTHAPALLFDGDTAEDDQ